MNLTFPSRTVAVSGAGHGFGAAIAHSFARLGARVFGCAPPVAATAPAATTEGVTMARVDLTDRAAAAAWIAGIEQETGGPIDILVNNAGGVAGQMFQPIEDVSDTDWDQIVAINLGAAFSLTRAAAAGMKRARSGRIINISSGAGLQASLTGIQAYCSAKHAVIGFTRQMAHELGPFGITVNSVAPGLVPSNPASAAQWDGYGKEKQAAMLQAIALHRLGTPQDIANAVLFFASPLADFVNGQILQVDGGR
jgi:3-oxoacyl-[acyl-carrier protein] reductase